MTIVLIKYRYLWVNMYIKLYSHTCKYMGQSYLYQEQQKFYISHISCNKTPINYVNKDVVQMSKKNNFI